MKKLLSVVLVFCVLFSVSCSFADKHIYGHYSLFVDGEFYNSLFDAGFEFDTQMMDFYLYSDFSGGYFTKEEWIKGGRRNYGTIEVSYVKNNGAFKLMFEDGSFYDGYWDENDEDLWISLGEGIGYFRFVPVHNFDISKDMKTR